MLSTNFNDINTQKAVGAIPLKSIKTYRRYLFMFFIDFPVIVINLIAITFQNVLVVKLKLCYDIV